MNIDSANYYSLVLDAENVEFGDALIKDVMRQLDNDDDREALETAISTAYSLDVRSLIGFALSCNEYSFDIGGMCHVIGHSVRPSIKTVLDLVTKLHHPQAPRIKSLEEKVNSFS